MKNEEFTTEFKRRARRTRRNTKEEVKGKREKSKIEEVSLS